MSAALTITGALAATTGTVFSLAPLLQVRRIVRVGAATGVSAGVYVIILVNSGAWLAYSLPRDLAALTWPNIVAILCATAALVTIRLYRQPRPGPAPAADVDEHQGDGDAQGVPDPAAR